MSTEFFLEMAWKSALIAGAALALATALRSRAAADRALVLRIGIVMLLGLPAIALLVPALQVEFWAASEAAPLTATAMAEAGFAAPLPATFEAPVAATTLWDDPAPLILILYLGGLVLAAGRLASGLWTLHRWTAAARTVDRPEWRAALERVRWTAPNGERLRLLVSDAVPSPLSWGWRHPVVLIDPDTLDDVEGAEAILAHELAHVARGDWPALLLSRVAAALFWFNPLVWLLEREVVQQAEEAADCAAAERVEPARYAQTLLSCAQSARGLLPANSMAPRRGGLARRVRAILDRGTRERPAGSAWTALAMLLCIGVAAPVAAVELVEARPPASPGAPAAPAPAPAPAPVGAPATPAAAPVPPAPPELAAITITAHPHAEAPTPPEPPHAVRGPAPMPGPAAIPGPRVAPGPPPVPRGPRPAAPAPTGLVDVDTLVSLRVHGVDARFMDDLAAIGPIYARLSTRELTSMAVHGVSPAYIRAMAAAGYRNLDVDRLIAMRIHGVTVARARRAAEIEGRRPSVERLIDLAIHGRI